MRPSVSIVVPTYNRAASLERTLHALANQTVGVDTFEVIVVDDGSSDRTPERLRALAMPFALRVLQQAHAGPAQARNLGVANAHADLILFLDDDVVPLPDLIEQHLRTHADATDLVVVGPMQPPRDWQRPPWVRWEEEMLQVQYRAMLNDEYACSPRQFYTANASVRRDRFMAVGGFDTSFQRAEDVELAFRLRDHGARFAFNHRAAIMHYASRSFQSWLHTPRQYGRYDVVMHRDKDQVAFVCAVREFHGRHTLTRVLARLCVGRPTLFKLAALGLRAASLAAECLGARRATSLILSGLFNVMYWQGVCDELGGRAIVLNAIDAGRSPDAQLPTLCLPAA